MRKYIAAINKDSFGGTVPVEVVKRSLISKIEGMYSETAVIIGWTEKPGLVDDTILVECEIEV